MATKRKNVPPPPSNKAAFEEYVQRGWASPFGLDYVFVLNPQFRAPELVSAYGGTVGIRWVNFAQIKWSSIEKTAPKDNRHTYDWTALDDGVREWQYFGIHIMMSLINYNSWATASPNTKENVYLKGPLKWIQQFSDYLPKPEHRQDFRDYITSLVERYDGDGIDDMPGLLFPVLHYQLGNEYDNELFWAGTVDEYLIYLQEGYLAAKKANKDVKIILSGVNFESPTGFYEKTLSPRESQFFRMALPQAEKHMVDLSARMNRFSTKTVAACKYYDILDIRWPFYGKIKHGKRLLQKYGCKDKEIWSAEAYSQFPLLVPPVIATALHPYPTPSKSKEYYRILKNRRSPLFEKVNAWYRGLQAAYVVKQFMAGLSAGTRKIMMGWGFDGQSVLAPYPMAVDGLYSGTYKKLWPAGHTFKVMIAELNGITLCRRLSTPDYVYVYECTVRNGEKVLVAFYDDHIGQNLDEPLGHTRLQLPFRAKSAKVTHIITTIDQMEPKVEQVQTRHGKLPLTLTEYPIFIQARHR